MTNFEAITEAAKVWDLEVLEVALQDAKKRAKDGMEIKNIPYVEKQLKIAEIIQNEIMVRKVQQ